MIVTNPIDQIELEKNRRQNETGSDSGHGSRDTSGGRDGRRPRITVLYTTIEGTLAALDAAVHFAKGLEAAIVLLVAEELPACYPLDHPPLAASFFERVSRAILEELQLDDSVTAEIYFFRHRVHCFATRLAPGSLVMVGAKHHGGQRREQRLTQTLKALGHEALLVQSHARSNVLRNRDAEHARSVVERLLSQNTEPES